MKHKQLVYFDPKLNFGPCKVNTTHPIFVHSAWINSKLQALMIWLSIRCLHIILKVSGHDVQIDKSFKISVARK